jgi:phosphinothricin acetyltransferase
MTSLRAAMPADAEGICSIYNHYIKNTTISLEETPVISVEMSQRVVDGLKNFPWIVIKKEGVIQGYAYATKWRVRSAYRHSVEVSVYLCPDSVGKSFGRFLYEYLLNQLAELGVRVVIGGIALPKEASVGLHEKMGFTKVAHFEQVGFKKDQWIYVGYWQKIL